MMSGKETSVESGWITRMFSFVEFYDLYRILYDSISNAIIMHCTIGCSDSVVTANVLSFIIHICVNWKNITFTLGLLLSVGNIKYRDDQNRTLACLVILL